MITETRLPTLVLAAALVFFLLPAGRARADTTINCAWAQWKVIML